MTAPKRHVFVPVVTALASIALFFAAKPLPPDPAVMIHIVKNGESVSLVCIRCYGRYTAEMGKAVKKMNPSVKDINIIMAGQKLRLPDPDKQAEAPAQAKTGTPKAPAAADAGLFEKKVNATQGVVTCVEGKAFVTAKGATAKKKLSVNTLVYPGDVLQTGKPGRVEIIINRESVVRMKENSRLTIEAFRDNTRQKGSTKLGSSLGTVWAKIKKFRDAISRFELELPTAVAGVHGTVYQAEVDADSSAEVKVYEGEVAVKSRPASKGGGAEGVAEVPGPEEIKGPREVSVEQWTEILRAMQLLAIDREGRPSPVQVFAEDSTDSWEEWNEERDEQIEDILNSGEEEQEEEE